MSPLLRGLIWTAAKRLAADPRVRQTAAEAVQRARPRVEAAAREVRAIVREGSPLDDPGGFARKLRDRVLKR